MEDVVEWEETVAPFKKLNIILLDDFKQTLNYMWIFDLPDVQSTQKPHQKILPQQKIGEAIWESIQDGNKLLVDEPVIELVDELAGDAEKLAVDGLHFHVSELVVEEGREKFEDVGKSLRIWCELVEFKDVQVGKVGVQSSVIVDIYCFEGINIYSRIFENLTMVLTGDIVNDFFLVEAGSEERVIKGE